MTRYRIDLAYDGGPYAGFAKQSDRQTVQGVLEDALSVVVRHEVSGVCAGRTDKGVHALGQVMHVDLDPQGDKPRKAVRDLDVLRDRIDGLVGDAITIWRIREVPDSFDARFSASWRFYRYRLTYGPVDPRIRHEVWRVADPLDVPAMAEALTSVLGEHDFAAFCRFAEGRTTRRRVLEAEVFEVEGPEFSRVGHDEVQVTMRGTAFCHQQVRATVGSLVEVGRGRQDAAWFAEVLARCDRTLAGPVAPAQGLTLEAVGYPDPWPDAPAR